ncbi:MAG: endonuclease I [Marinilabiliales bacterium]|nr:MAG: endonuclease I [Marinilabiliales bacterium]
MKLLNRLIISIGITVFTVTGMIAQVPAGYYDGTEGLEGETLRQALHNIIDDHTTLSYSDLWDAYEDTDKRSDGKVWDMYSNCNFTFGSDQCGTYSDICDCYNREHSVPQSWFNDANPMVTDIHHVIPTDGKVNGYRSNYPFGECNGTTYGTGKLGSCTYSGYSGTVFEPADEYKGDIARIYFYMATRYMDVMGSWPGCASFSGNNLSTWTRQMLLEWHHDDPVSQKEIYRNNSIYYDYQHNRNPFIDNPTYADAIWDPDYNPSYITITEAYFTVYPNPANSSISIEANFDSEVKEISIQDIC